MIDESLCDPFYNSCLLYLWSYYFDSIGKYINNFVKDKFSNTYNPFFSSLSLVIIEFFSNYRSNKKSLKIQEW